MGTETRVLVVTGLSRKLTDHYGPLVDVAEETTILCFDPDPSLDGASYRTVPTFGHRLLGIVLLFFASLIEASRGEYDAVVSISLFPYGLYALAVRYCYGIPAHLGIIGIDIDQHAHAWYGGAVRSAFRRFDVVSVPGQTHANELAGMGVDRHRIEILTNTIDVDRFTPTADGETAYDFLWLGRFNEEKDPLLFVDSLARLRSMGVDFRAAMVGSGPLEDDVGDAIRHYGLGDSVDLPGWADDPLEYYASSDVFVLTSSRDAMPLSLIEAMSTGLACVVPSVGSIPDVVDDEENAVLVTDRSSRTFATEMARLHRDQQRRTSLATTAIDVRSDFAPERAGEDWAQILTTMTNESKAIAA